MLIHPSKTRFYQWVPWFAGWIVPGPSFCHAALATHYFVYVSPCLRRSSTLWNRLEKLPTVSRVPVSSQLVCEPNPFLSGWLQELAG
jgi:hypothetical protein